MSNKIKGKYGEDIAVNYLIKNKYKIIERNYHFSRYGEVDVIALDKDTLCFIEVKTRTNNKFGTPLEAVTPLKLNKIQKCALFFTSNFKDPKIKFKKFRIDVISVLLNSQNNAEVPEIFHIKNIEF